MDDIYKIELLDSISAPHLHTHTTHTCITHTHITHTTPHTYTTSHTHTQFVLTNDTYDDRGRHGYSSSFYSACIVTRVAWLERVNGHQLTGLTPHSTIPDASRPPQEHFPSSEGGISHVALECESHSSIYRGTLVWRTYDDGHCQSRCWRVGAIWLSSIHTCTHAYVTA